MTLVSMKLMAFGGHKQLLNINDIDTIKTFPSDYKFLTPPLLVLWQCQFQAWRKEGRR